MPVNNAALVVGGGIAGMTAALALAEQGFPVHLVEKCDDLGGTARQIHRTLDGQDVQALLAETDPTASTDPSARLPSISKSQRGEGRRARRQFTSTIADAEGDSQRDPARRGRRGHRRHGAETATFGYGQSPRVLTQLELSDRLGRGEISLPEQATVAMIQCVEQRDDERPYCSRVCCTTAVKNALDLRTPLAGGPDRRALPRHADLRLPRGGLPRGAGEGRAVRPLRARAAAAVGTSTARLRLRVREPSLGRDLELEPDLVVLAAPMVPRADRGELSELLRVPLNADGFFLEAT